MKKVLLLMCLGVLLLNISPVFSRELYNSATNEVLKKMTTTKVRASHILVATEEEANKLREDILSKKISFGDAAKEYSKCPSGKSGGDLGFFGKGMMVKEFDNSVFSLSLGEVSEPIKTQFGWHLIVVTDMKLDN
jgi:peptidyl-prolyl cis-trans isomerase C